VRGLGAAHGRVAMPLPGSSSASPRTRPSGSRSRASTGLAPTYLSRAALLRAPTLMAVQKSKSASLDISGEQWQELWAEIQGPGAHCTPGRSNRPLPDAYKNGCAYSLKTTAVRPALSRPSADDWLGQPVEFIIARLTPQSLPRGATMSSVGATALGRRLINAYNTLLETYAWERLSFLVRLRCEPLAAWQYLYWEQDAELLAPAAYRWRESGNARELDRNLSASLRGSEPGGADLRWTSSGRQLYMREYVPFDADIWTVPDEMVLSRDEATQAVLSAINARLLAA
jgi:hypothetical protein